LKKKKAGKEFETIDPRTEEVIAKIAEGGKEDIDVAVKAARVAFDHGPWPRMPGAVRYRCSSPFSTVTENFSVLTFLCGSLSSYHVCCLI